MAHCSARLSKGGPQGAVQTVLEVERALILDHVREEIAVEGGVLGEQLVERQLPFRGDQIGEPDRARRDLRPRLQRRVVIGVRGSVPDRFENHGGCPFPSETFPRLSA